MERDVRQEEDAFVSSFCSYEFFLTVFIILILCLCELRWSKSSPHSRMVIMLEKLPKYKPTIFVCSRTNL